MFCVLCFSLCYTIVPPVRKSCFRAGFRPDFSWESGTIGPPAGRRVWLRYCITEGRILCLLCGVLGFPLARFVLVFEPHGSVRQRAPTRSSDLVAVLSPRHIPSRGLGQKAKGSCEGSSGLLPKTGGGGWRGGPRLGNTVELLVGMPLPLQASHDRCAVRRRPGDGDRRGLQSRQRSLRPSPHSTKTKTRTSMRTRKSGVAT